MAGSVGRSLVVGLSADTTKFSRELKGAQKEVAKFKDGVGKMGKAITAGFTGMAVAVGAFAKSAVDAALEDQQSQKLLARTLQQNIKTHRDLSKAMEKSITGIQKASGVSDTKLRKSFGKLVIATKSVTKSQKIMRTALNISAGTGKDLETVVTALSKAYLGNNGALGRLGTGLSKAELKAMSFTKVQAKLDATYKGAGATAANTMQGKLERLKTSYSEIVEQVGYALLPVLNKFVNWITAKGVPMLQSFVDGFTGAKGANKALKNGTDKAFEFGQKVKGFIEYLTKHTGQVKAFAEAVGLIWTVGKVSNLIHSVDRAVKAFQILRGAALGAAGAENAALGGGAIGTGLRVAGRAISAVGGASVALAAGTTYVGNKIYSKALGFSGGPDPRNKTLMDLRARESALFMKPNRSKAESAQLAAMQTAEKQIQNVNITINGAIDVQGTARQIQKILQQNSLTGFAIQTVGTPVPKK